MTIYGLLSLRVLRASLLRALRTSFAACTARLSHPPPKTQFRSEATAWQLEEEPFGRKEEL
jgi:hypothetical protein